MNEFLSNWAKFVSKTCLNYAPKYMAVSIEGHTYYTEYTEDALIKDGYLPVIDPGKPEDGKQYIAYYKLSSDNSKIEVYYEEYVPTRKELLLNEKYKIEAWFTAHDYIGTKIATGRAVIADYKAEIEQMKIKAIQLEAIRKELEDL